jgi:hypothetical protein
MIETLLISFIAIFFAWIARFQKSKFGGLEIAFIILTLFMSIRYNFGNDYAGYLEKFLIIGKYSSFDTEFEHLEIGWIFLCYIFQPIGFFGMIIVLTIFEYAVIYRLIKKNVTKDWYWLSVVIFTLNTSHMLIFSSMMRQFLAMCIFILAAEYIIKKQWIFAVILVILASTIHSSALVLIPFVFFGYIGLTLTRKKAIIWFGIYLLLHFIAVELLSDYVFSFLAIDQFAKYELYIGQEKEGFKTGFGVIFNLVLYAFLLFHQEYQSKKMKIIFLLFATYAFFYVLMDIAPILGRLGYYFSVFSIICYPWLFKVIKEDFLKYTLVIVYFIIICKSFFDFFDPTGIWHKSFYNYQTIFSVSDWI